jgi:pimeloyl-ACP methyl ester carboxylesterase
MGFKLSALQCCLVMIVLVVLLEWYLQRFMFRVVPSTIISIGLDVGSHIVVHCSHGLSESAHSFSKMFTIAAASPERSGINGGTCWFSYTRSPHNTLDGADIVEQCSRRGTVAILIGHSMGAVPTVRAAEKWLSHGYRIAGIVLLAPAVDAKNAFWNGMPMAHATHVVFSGLSPRAWQWLLTWGPAFPVVVWWLALSYVGNGWAPIEQIDRQRYAAMNGLRSIKNLLNVDVAIEFNETLDRLIRRGVDVVMIHDAPRGTFSISKRISMPKTPLSHSGLSKVFQNDIPLFDGMH